MGYLKRKAVVLQYQNISEDKENFLDTWINQKKFEQQLDYLSKKNIPILPLHDIVAYVRGDLTIKIQSFSLTFDTGYHDLYTLCYPLLKKHGYPATFFIQPNTVGKTETIKGRTIKYMTWDQIRDMQEHGMLIGFYGCCGKNIAKVPLEEIRQEIHEEKIKFQNELSKKICYYGVREGVPLITVIQLLKNEGFEALFCQVPTHQKTHLYAMGRIQIDDNDPNIFLVKTSRSYIFFKDSRCWKYIRRYKVDKLAHFMSNTYNHFKRKPA